MNSRVPGYPETIEVAKSQARRLGTALGKLGPISHGQALEAVARLHGERSWGMMSSRMADASAREKAYDLGILHSPPSGPLPVREHHGWKPNELSGIVDVLRSRQRPGTSPRHGEILARVISDGCVTVDYVDDLLDAVSPALGDLSYKMTGSRMVELFGIRSETYLHRPGATDVGTTGSTCISLAGAAALLMRLERLGFDARPEPLVDAVNKSAAGKRMLTPHEVDCLWYAAEKGAGGQRLVADGRADVEDAPSDVFRTATGYRCAVRRSPTAGVVAVQIDPPTP